MTKALLIVIGGLILAVMLFGAWRLAQPQECPTFDLGETVYIYAGDGFDGRPVRVFQPGWTADQRPVYIVELISTDPAISTGGYIAATGCQLQRVQP